MKKGLIFLTVLAVAATLLAGCALPGAPTPGPTTQPLQPELAIGTIEVRVTDAPPEYGDIKEIWVEVLDSEEEGIAVHKAATNEQGEGEWITIPITGENPFDLLLLDKENMEALLGDAQVIAGKYTQIRMTVEEVTVIFEGDTEEVNDDTEKIAKLPSGKLKFIQPFEVIDGETTIILIDFLADKSVTITGKGDVIFKPVIKLMVSGKGKPAELEATLESDTKAEAELSTDQAYTGDDSAHLETLGDPGSGDEARIVIPVPEGTTLADIAAVSWWEYLVAGYPPHLDIMLDINGDGTIDDSLVFEYAYNDVALHYLEGPMPYGALTGDWYQTFSDDGNGPAQVDDTAYGWLSSGPPGAPGDPTFISGTLADWKSGSVNTAIDGITSVVSLEIEIDNWVVQSEAYIDDIVIVIDGVTYTVVFDLD